MRRLAIVLAVATLPAAAHESIDHATADSARQLAEAAPAEFPLPFNLGGSFTLKNQHGKLRSEADPNGRLQLLFFGYANCPSICTVALPLMAEAVDALRAEGVAVTPVMITVDPVRDTVETIGPPLEAIHPDFEGLTGTETELALVRSLFGVERKVVFEDPEHGRIFAHGSFIYLLDDEGAVLTILPPVLSAERIAVIAVGYAGH